MGRAFIERMCAFRDDGYSGSPLIAHVRLVQIKHGLRFSIFWCAKGARCWNICLFFPELVTAVADGWLGRGLS